MWQKKKRSIRVIMFLRVSAASFGFLFCCVIETWTPHGWMGEASDDSELGRVTPVNKR